MRLSVRRRRRAIKLGSVLVLLLAVMPQVLYLGHPLSGDGSTAATTGHEHHDQVAAEHANHCHVGPKSCAAADGVVNAAPSSDVLAVLAREGGFYTLERDETIATFALWQRPEKPPRTV